MSKQSKFVRSGDLAREFNLPEPLARQIVMEHTRQALRRSGVAWTVLLAGCAAAAWLRLGPAPNGDLALKVLIGTAVAWLVAGRLLAGPGARQAARERSTRSTDTSR